MENSRSTGYNFGREQNNRNESSPSWTKIAARVAVAVVAVSFVAGDHVASFAVVFVAGVAVFVAGAAAFVADATAIARGLFRYLSSSSSSSVPVPNSDPGFGGERSSSSSDSAGGSDLIDGWQFPEKGWIKCNVDGSFLPKKESSGCGGVFRDSKGNWLYGFSEKLDYSGDLTRTEIEAIYMGLKVAWERGYKKLIIWSDSTAAVNLVKNGVPASHRLALPVNQARKYLKKDWEEIEIGHIPREYNKDADNLADLSHSLVERLKP